MDYYLSVWFRSLLLSAMNLFFRCTIILHNLCFLLFFFLSFRAIFSVALSFSCLFLSLNNCFPYLLFDYLLFSVHQGPRTLVVKGNFFLRCFHFIRVSKHKCLYGNVMGFSVSLFLDFRLIGFNHAFLSLLTSPFHLKALLRFLISICLAYPNYF